MKNISPHILKIYSKPLLTLLIALILFLVVHPLKSFAQITVANSNGDDGAYTSLTNAGGAFAALNVGASQAGSNVTISITADVATEAGINALTSAAGMWTTLTITPCRARTISGAPAPVIFGEEGDEPLLGLTTLESLGLVFNPFKRELYPMRMLMI